MYEFVTGPLLWISFLIFFSGTLYRIRRLYSLTEKREVTVTPPGAAAPPAAAVSAEERKLNLVVSFQNSLLGKHPVMAIVSTIFHICLFAAPLLSQAHNLLIYESWGISFISIPDKLCDVLTIIFLACAVFFLVRRLTVPKVIAVSSPYDFLVLFITAAPFLSGFCAYHQWLDYKTVLTAHVITGEIMLVAIPFTKLGHMVFFFFVRILIGGEYSFGSGRRAWKT